MPDTAQGPSTAASAPPASPKISTPPRAIHVVAVLLAGAALCLAVLLWISRGAGAKLDADLKRADDANVTLASDASAVRRDNAQLRADLADATAYSDRLAAGLQAQSGQLAAEHQRSVEQQQLIDRIAVSLAGSGGDLGKRLDALAAGFVELYKRNHPAR